MRKLCLLAAVAILMAGCSVTAFESVQQDDDGTVIISGAQTFGSGIDGVVLECRDQGNNLRCRRTNAGDVISSF